VVSLNEARRKFGSCAVPTMARLAGSDVARLLAERGLGGRPRSMQGGTRRKDCTGSSFSIREKTIEPSGFCEAKNSSRLPFGVRLIADHGKKLKTDSQHWQSRGCPTEGWPPTDK